MTRRLRGRIRSADPRALTLGDFHSADAAMAKCLDRARLAAETDLPILIVGESGTGKTLLARAIHNSSKRAHGPFIAFNAAALSDTLLDSQLFGHEKGAFTGAERTVRGKFELADAGTLFIDEIADMTENAQAKILRAVEYGEFEKLGSEALQVADVRLISATHWPLQKFVDSNRFRKDLFYRISGVALTIPPLRERPHDLRSLIASEIARASEKEGKTIAGLTKEATELLCSYAWPGNLRQLKTVIQAAIALTKGDIIAAEAILVSPGSESVKPVAEASPDLTLAMAEWLHVHHVLDAVGGNKRRAAKALGIARSTLDRKLGAHLPT